MKIFEITTGTLLMWIALLVDLSSMSPFAVMPIWYTGFGIFIGGVTVSVREHFDYQSRKQISEH